MRTSSYNIYVKLPEENNYLIIQGYTGAVDCISKNIYEYLKNEGSKTEQVSQETLKQLKDRGYLTNGSFIEERRHLSKIANIFHKRHLQGMGVLFAPTFSCQLRCPYCYEAPVAHREDEHSKEIMTFEHVKSAFAAIDQLVESFKKKLPEDITLYGGEPLMAENYEIVKQIVEEGKDRKIHFRAVTNGYDLLEYKDLLGKDKIGYLQITIDGTEEIHNKRRFTKKGQPTFNNVCDSVQLALDQNCTVVVRTNVDKANINDLSALNQFYFDKGWSKHPNFYPYANVTHDWLKKELLQPTDLLNTAERLFGQEEKEGRVIKIDFGISQCFGALLRPGKIPVLRPYFCGPNIGSYIFGPDGYIYTCWDEVGLEEGRIGQYFPQLFWNESRAKEWLDRNVTNIPECLDCSYALICGGGCAQQAKKTTGSIFRAYCFQFKEVFNHLAPRLYYGYIKMIKDQKEKKH